MNAIRYVGFVLTVLSFFVTGWVFAWNQPAIVELIAQTGGIFPLIGAIIGIVATFLVVFWPSRWSARARSIATAAVIVGLFIGRDFIMAAITQAPWLSLLVIVGGALWVWFLIGLTVYGQLIPPLPRRTRHHTAPATTGI